MRKETTVTCQDRTGPLVFKIHEMSTPQLENWTSRAVIMLGEKLGLTMNDVSRLLEVVEAGKLGELNGVDLDALNALMDEMLACCSRVITGPHGGMEQRVNPDSVGGYVEDYKVLFQLRVAALKLHFDVAESQSHFFDFSHKKPGSTETAA